MASQAAPQWAERRTLHHSEFPVARIAAEREHTISVCLPARNEERTIGPILDALVPLLGADAIDQLVVVDDSSDDTAAIAQLVVVDDSSDDTAAIARAAGAEVHDQSALHAELGPVQGKGDAMWRALSVLSGEIICYLDADSELFGAHFATGLVGPVGLPGPVVFAKAFYRRPSVTDRSSTTRAAAASPS